MVDNMPTDEFSILDKRISTLEQDIRQGLKEQNEKQERVIEVLTDIRIELQNLKQVEKNEEKLIELERKFDKQQSFYNKLIGGLAVFTFLMPFIYKIFL